MPLLLGCIKKTTVSKRARGIVEFMFLFTAVEQTWYYFTYFLLYLFTEPPVVGGNVWQQGGMFWDEDGLHPGFNSRLQDDQISAAGFKPQDLPGVWWQGAGLQFQRNFLWEL